VLTQKYRKFVRICCFIGNNTKKIKFYNYKVLFEKINRQGLVKNKPINKNLVCGYLTIKNMLISPLGNPLFARRAKRADA
jgi:hypothetical protein